MVLRCPSEPTKPTTLHRRFHSSVSEFITGNRSYVHFCLRPCSSTFQWATLTTHPYRGTTQNVTSSQNSRQAFCHASQRSDRVLMPFYPSAYRFVYHRQGTGLPHRCAQGQAAGCRCFHSVSKIQALAFLFELPCAGSRVSRQARRKMSVERSKMIPPRGELSTPGALTRAFAGRPLVA